VEQSAPSYPASHEQLQEPAVPTTVPCAALQAISPALHADAVRDTSALSTCAASLARVHARTRRCVCAASLHVSVTAADSGSSTQCTASAATGDDVSLTWTQAAQTHVRVRACTSASDAAQVDNADVALAAAVSVAIAPTTLDEGGTLTATYSGWASGAIWICYRSGTTEVGTSPSCGAAESASTVTAAGSGSSLQCTASAATGEAVSLTWTEAAQTHVRVRAMLHKWTMPMWCLPRRCQWRSHRRRWRKATH